MEPTEAINSFEVAVRRLIIAEWGTDWLAKSGFDVEKLRTALRREQENRRGAIVSTGLLDYTEFSQLATLLRERWSVFAPVFQGQKYISTYLGRLIHLRNGPMHSRELLAFEREQLSGMIGEILNMIAIYRSSKGPDMQHYPVTDSVVDNFGNIGRPNENCYTGMRLEVGQVLTFTCRGTDPQGRDLMWYLSGQSIPQLPVTAAPNDAAELSLVVNSTLVREDFVVLVYMRSVGRYHRNGDTDTCTIFHYAVDPPV